MDYLAISRCKTRAYGSIASGRFLPGGLPGLVATTEDGICLLVASEGHQDGEGSLEIVCEQPLYAAARSLARIPAAAAATGGALEQQQVMWLGIGR